MPVPIPIPMHRVAAAGQAEIVIVAGCLAAAAAAAAGFLGNGAMGKAKEAPTRCMIARLVVWLVQSSSCVWVKAGLAPCGIAWLPARPGQAYLITNA